MTSDVSWEQVENLHETIKAKDAEIETLNLLVARTQAERLRVERTLAAANAYIHAITGVGAEPH